MTTSSAPVLMACDALLFDMDGTVLDSFVAANRAWGAWAADAGLGEEFSLQGGLHGRQRPEVIAELLPHLDAAQVQAHAAAIQRAEAADVRGTVAIPGAAHLLRALPPERWAIVTAADAEVARARIIAADLPLPGVLVSADDLDRGKPDPQGYLLAAERLGFAPARCIVLEDAAAGLAAAANAGMQAVALRTTTPDHQLTPAVRIIDDLRGVRAELSSGGLTLVVDARP